MKNKSTLIAVILSIFSISAFANDIQVPAQSKTLKKAALDIAADYGVPIAAETTLEALRATFEPVKNAAMEGICGSGPQYYICWYLSNSIDLQKYNLQSGFSRHLQDKVAAYSNNVYNTIFAPEKPQGTVIAEQGMAAWRSATTKAQSLESIKARITLGQLRPILDSLFGHAAELYSRKGLNPSREAARTIAFATIWLAAYFPEYSGNEDEISSNLRPLLARMKELDPKAQEPTYFRSLVEAELANQMTVKAAQDPKLVTRINRILCAWTLENQSDCEACKLIETETHESIEANSDSHTMTFIGLVGPSFIFNLYPRQGDTVSLILKTTFNSLASNGAEAATRVDLTDFFADLRRTVQRIGTEQEKRDLLKPDSYNILRERELFLTKAWSELGKRMRANMLRYLSLIVPTFVEVSNLLDEGRTQEAAATLATLLSYVRQYDPEYKTDDIFIKMAAHAIFGDSNFLASTGFCNAKQENPFLPRSATQDLLGELYVQLAQLETNFEVNSCVGDYYNAVLKNLSEPLNQSNFSDENKEPSALANAPWFSVGLSWMTDVTNAVAKATLANLVKGLKSPALQTLIKEEYNRLGEVVVRGVGEPAKEDIQQWLTSLAAKRSDIEEQLVAGAVEMNGRTGGDAQMARAIYERIQPVLFHLLDSAREAYQIGDKATAARLMGYSLVFLAYYYPEAPADDVLISGLAKSRFSQFVSDNDQELEQNIANEIAYFIKSGAARLSATADMNWTHHILSFDRVLACHLKARMQSFSLSTTSAFRLACGDDESVQSWYDWTVETGKATGYYVGLTGVALLPAFVQILMPKSVSIPGVENRWVNFAATCVTKGTVGLGVNSIFGGITGNFMNKAKSVAQRWTQWLRATPRVDETENSGRSQAYFGGRQAEVPLFINPNAQEGRKDLLTVAQNIAQNLKNAKNAQLAGNKQLAQSQISSLHILLSTFFSEATAHYEPLLADMNYAFFGHSSVDFGPQKVVNPCDNEKTQECMNEAVEHSQNATSKRNIESGVKSRDEL